MKKSLVVLLFVSLPTFATSDFCLVNKGLSDPRLFRNPAKIKYEILVNGEVVDADRLYKNSEKCISSTDYPIDAAIITKFYAGSIDGDWHLANSYDKTDWNEYLEEDKVRAAVYIRSLDHGLWMGYAYTSKGPQCIVPYFNDPHKEECVLEVNEWDSLRLKRGLQDAYSN